MLYGHNTSILPKALPLAEAAAAYPRWYAVVVDPVRQATELVSGQVAAVSKTRDGAFRALTALGPVDRTVTVTKLT